MAKIREIDTTKDIVENYSTEEIIRWLAKAATGMVKRCDERVSNDEPYKIYLELPNLARWSEVLNALDIKINGQKGPNLL